MTELPISDGEARDLRARLGLVEKEASKAASEIAVHEATCSARYRNLVLLILGLAAANSVAAFPHLLQILPFVLK